MKVIRLLNLVMVVLAPPVWAADMPTEPRGGKPPAGSKPWWSKYSPETRYSYNFLSSDDSALRRIQKIQHEH